MHQNLWNNRTPVKIVNNAKYLGVIIDNELNFHELIKIMEGKVARSVGIQNKLKLVLKPLQYVATLLCINTYFSIVWCYYMEGHEFYLYTEITILTKSS